MREDKMSTNSQFMNAIKNYCGITENGAVSHSTTGKPLLDYFAKCGTYRDRDQADVDAQLSKMWADSPLFTLRLIFYVRMISRKSVSLSGEKCEQLQTGQGCRDEFRKCLLWLAKKQPESLYTNLHLVPVVGSWKDLWHDSIRDALDFKQVLRLIKSGMADDYHRSLIAKFLPRIRSVAHRYNPDHQARHQWAMRLCSELGWTSREYRLFKSDPSHTAHNFQRIISAKKWSELDYGHIPGRALFRMIAHKGKDGKTFLERHSIEKDYISWTKKQPTVKFTGYIYELFTAAQKANKTQKITFNKQFQGLIDQAKEGAEGLDENVWCALDTSGSMQSKVIPGVSAYDICLSLGIFFSTLNKGAFKDHVIMFNKVSYNKVLTGSFCDKINQLRREKIAWGSTNFQSVIDAIVTIRENSPKIPIKDYPTTLLVVSDMQFNPVGGNTQSNYDAAMEKFKSVGLPKIKIIWWYVNGHSKDFPSTFADEGVTMIGGFDGSIIRMLLGGEEVRDVQTGKKRQLNAYENMIKCLIQPLLREVSLS